MTMAEASVNEEGLPANNEGDDSSVRFEDLTVDDDLAILERVIKYTQSSIALQRLVHVKMLSETAIMIGNLPTMQVLVPSIQPLLQDAESVIRQHVAAQLLPVSLVCMLERHSNTNSDTQQQQQHFTIQQHIDNPQLPKSYNEVGYKMVLKTIVPYLFVLLQDAELDVRRAASDALSGLSLYLKTSRTSTSTDLDQLVSLPLQLATNVPSNTNANAPKPTKRTEQEQRAEELRISSINVLAELAGSQSEHSNNTNNNNNYYWTEVQLLDPLLALTADPSFRVRRCLVQAMPRLLGGCPTKAETILKAFTTLSKDDIHRVRKSTGECLVDMSRALTILIEAVPSQKDHYLQWRRVYLLPIAEQLIQDSHKLVRQGMMQFLGPFIASFYPFLHSKLSQLLPTVFESDGSNHPGIVSQFFPHSSSMVSRLNSSVSTQTAPTPVHSDLQQLSPISKTEWQLLQQWLPPFLHSARLSSMSLEAVSLHRSQFPPVEQDIQAIVDALLDYFVALAAVNTGDENTDAEMRVYCAYSFPAIILLLGKDHWEGAVRTCFHTLLNPKYPEEPDEDDEEEDCEPPLPVKRCLASSLHTVAHILGPELANEDIVEVVQNYFLNDPDDSVRLSTIRNLPSILKLLNISQRRALFLQYSEIIMEDILPVKKRSATNPTVLNWRQRDYLARSLPDLLYLMEPAIVHKHIWKILKLLLADSINVVRDDALWSIPILLQVYTAETLSKWRNVAEHAKKFSSEGCLEIVTWIKENILHTDNPRKATNFNERQLYCRICAAVGLALRFGEDKKSDDAHTDPVSVLSDKFKSLFVSKEGDSGPYQALTSAEHRHLKKLLTGDLLPLALEMKEDRVSNVRITLMKTLQILPADIRESSAVKHVLKDLEEESETWTSFGEEEPSLFELKKEQDRLQQERAASGPVDVDDFDNQSTSEGEVEPESSESTKGEEPPKEAKAKRAPSAKVKSLGSGDGAPAAAPSSEAVPTTAKAPPAEKPKNKLKSVFRSVVFEEGSIGMQLEPTANDRACRVCGFLDADDTPSPARLSGKINIGDVIVEVNGKPTHSYDDTIAVLRSGGRRKVTFRPGRPEDEEEIERGKVKRQHSTSSTKKKKHKHDKHKKEKKAKKEKKKSKKHENHDHEEVEA